MHDYFSDYIIWKSFLTSGLCNPEVTLWGDTRRIKMYFHVVYGGARRRYEGAGRNSHKTLTGPNETMNMNGPLSHSPRRFEIKVLRQFLPAPHNIMQRSNCPYYFLKTLNCT